jgi:hypothetical protein
MGNSGDLNQPHNRNRGPVHILSTKSNTSKRARNDTLTHPETPLDAALQHPGGEGLIIPQPESPVVNGPHPPLAVQNRDSLVSKNEYHRDERLDRMDGAANYPLVLARPRRPTGRV